MYSLSQFIIFVYLCSCIFVYLCICVFVYLYMCVFVCICVLVYLCICVFVYLCICVFVYLCICVFEYLYLELQMLDFRHPDLLSIPPPFIWMGFSIPFVKCLQSLRLELPCQKSEINTEQHSQTLTRQKI